MFSNYGNITVTGNTFVDCVGWVLELENLQQHRPTLRNNTFTRCGDAISIRAKPDLPAQVLMWMDNNQIDTNGTGIFLFWMEVTMRNTTITGAGDNAIIADMSFVESMAAARAF